jgi:cystathionine beta-lyase/cystathionine gamma-synthase
MGKTNRQIDTKLIHAGEPNPLIQGAVSIPIFQSSTFEYTGQESYHDLRYIRLNNTPNHVALHEKLAALENGEAAVVSGSGMAAISTTLLALLSAGDHFLAQDCLYGGTHDLITKDLPAYGISANFICGKEPEAWKKLLRSNTKAVYVESITNPLMQVANLKGIVEFAREHRLYSIIDNTFTSPINFRPLEHGFDLSIHSCSKYLNGHSDIVAGAVIGPEELISKITHKLNHLGGTLDPHACFLLHRGMKTLAVRVRQQNASAMEIARFLESRPEVETVHYPGLASHPQHNRARELFDGFGGMLSFELQGGVELAERFIRNTTIPICAPSLGGVESLITRPVTTSHACLSPEECKEVGISESLIRLSVGLEATADILADFDQALRTNE